MDYMNQRTRTSGCSRNDVVDFFDRVHQLVVCVSGRQLQLQDPPVDLVDDERDGQSLRNRVLNDLLRLFTTSKQSNTYE